jgi:hypothetical protein
MHRSTSFCRIRIICHYSQNTELEDWIESLRMSNLLSEDQSETIDKLSIRHIISPNIYNNVEEDE